MTQNLSLYDKVSLNLYNYMYTASIAQQAADGKNSGGIIVIGMIIVVVGIVGFIMAKNK